MRAQVDMRPGTKSFPAIFQFHQHGVKQGWFERCRNWNWTWRFATGIRKRAYWILFQQRPYLQMCNADVRKTSWCRYEWTHIEKEAQRLWSEKTGCRDDLVQRLRDLILLEICTGPDSLGDYRTMWHVLRLRHNIHVPRQLVESVLREVDPRGVELRKRRCLHRRTCVTRSHL